MYAIHREALHVPQSLRSIVTPRTLLLEGLVQRSRRNALALLMNAVVSVMEVQMLITVLSEDMNLLVE